jgi:hypothetical protein
VVGSLAVGVPGYRVPWGKREEACLHISVDHQRLDVLHLIVRRLVFGR